MWCAVDTGFGGFIEGRWIVGGRRRVLALSAGQPEDFVDGGHDEMESCSISQTGLLLNPILDLCSG